MFLDAYGVTRTTTEATRFWQVGCYTGLLTFQRCRPGCSQLYRVDPGYVAATSVSRRRKIKHMFSLQPYGWSCASVLLLVYDLDYPWSICYIMCIHRTASAASVQSPWATGDWNRRIRHNVYVYVTDLYVCHIHVYVMTYDILYYLFTLLK